MAPQLYSSVVTTALNIAFVLQNGHQYTITQAFFYSVKTSTALFFLTFPYLHKCVFWTNCFFTLLPLHSCLHFLNRLHFLIHKVPSICSLLMLSFSSSAPHSAPLISMQHSFHFLATLLSQQYISFSTRNHANLLHILSSSLPSQSVQGLFAQKLLPSSCLFELKLKSLESSSIISCTAALPLAARQL